jgi:hypothetical protein
MQYVLEELRKRHKKVNCYAWTGVAAGLLGGQTLSKGFSLSSGDEAVPQSVKSQFTDDTIGVIIDEISTTSSSVFARVMRRLQLLTGASAPGDPFGSAMVICVGDCCQVRPVKDHPVYEDAVRLLVDNDPEVALHPLRKKGAELFAKLAVYELTQQQRAADDPEHVQLIDKMRRHDGRLVREDMKRFKELSAADLHATDSRFRYAPIIVTSNVERAEHNWSQAGRFATERGFPLIRWPVHVKRAGVTLETQQAMFETDHRLCGVFVKDAPAIITNNISTQHRICNGTQAKLHSLTFLPNNEEQMDELQQMYVEMARPCDDGGPHIIDISFAPFSVNVTMPMPKDGSTPPSLVPGEFVVPIGLLRDWDLSVETVETPLGLRRWQLHPHGVELAFSFTYHKVQGCTLERVILDLNERPFPPRLAYDMLYVRRFV